MKFTHIFKVAVLSAGLFSSLVFAETQAVAQKNSVTHAKSMMGGQFSPEQKQQLHTIIRQYLLENPELLVEVSQALQKKQRQEMLSQAKTSIDKNADALFSTSSPVAGNAKGNVTLVEFFDYQCGHCKKMAPVISKLLKKDSNLRVIYKEFPIFGKSSEVAAKAALAAGTQGKYQALHDELISMNQRLNSKLIMQAAKKAGLNVDKLKKDMESAEVKAQLKANMQLAEKMRLMGTPAFVVAATPDGAFKQGGKTFFIPGAASEDALQDLIRQASSGNS